MGELGIGVTDLTGCTECGFHNQLIFQIEKNDKWWIACGYRRCEHKTKEHSELLDACDEWGLKETNV
jgi:hypothetical protein